MSFVGDVELVVNGKPISINPFVSTLLGNVTTAILLSLKLDEQPTSMELHVTYKNEGKPANQ